MTITPITSPCIKVCAIQGKTGWCLGCGRTLEEIARWSALDEATRAETMSQLPARMEALTKAEKRGDAP